MNYILHTKSIDYKNCINAFHWFVIPTMSLSVVSQDSGASFMSLGLLVFGAQSLGVWVGFFGVICNPMLR